jgi:hypothetical protein
MEEIKTLQRQRAEAGTPVLYAVTVCNAMLFNAARAGNALLLLLPQLRVVGIVAPRTRAGVG